MPILSPRAATQTPRNEEDEKVAHATQGLDKKQFWGLAQTMGQILSRGFAAIAARPAPLRGRTPFIIGAAALTLLLVGALSYRIVGDAGRGDVLVRHSHRVLDNIERVQLAAIGIESNSRAYVITGEPAYYEARSAVIAGLRQDLSSLQRRTARYPSQQRRLPAIERLIDERIALSETAIALWRSGGFAAAVDATRAERNFELATQLSGALIAVRNEELDRLAVHEAAFDQRLALTRGMVTLAAVLVVLLAVATCWSFYREATRRRVAERALRHSEDQYEALVQGVEDHAIVMLDPLGVIMSWNTGAERMTGAPAEDVVGQSVSIFFSPEDFLRGAIGEILGIASKTGSHRVQGVLVRRDGTLFQVSSTFSAVRDAKGRLRGYSVISRDLTESAEAGAKYLGLLEAAPDAMVVVNQSGEIVLLNVQAEKQLGYRRDELLGQNVKNIIPEGFAERLVADGLRSAEEALAQQIGMGIELIALRKDGSEFPIELMLSPLAGPEGILVTAAIRDITARKAAEAHLLHNVEELKRSNEELGQFAYIASHDLQEPLRMVASYTRLLSKRYKGQLDTQADEFIDFAEDGANRMQRLIQDLLSYSRIGTRGEERREIATEIALGLALMNLRGAIDESGAIVTHGPLPRIVGDETQLIQLFQNLVGNAIKYQRTGVPEIHVAAVWDGVSKKWVFSVRDNGLGIDALYFEKIFGMFQRLHRRDEFDGTGIGLAICKKIVERHGGAISVESQPGQGSTFRFALAAA